MSEKMDNEIVVENMSLAILLRDTLEKSGNRNPKFKMMDYKRFTLEELATITSLKLEGTSYEDISPLKYCTNLKELSIISANAKNIDTKMSADAKYNYMLKKNKITDFSVISDLFCYNDFLDKGTWPEQASDYTLDLE